MRGTDNGQQAAALEPSDGMDPKTSLRIALNLQIWCFNCDFCSCGCVTMTAVLKKNNHTSRDVDTREGVSPTTLQPLIEK